MITLEARKALLDAINLLDPVTWDPLLKSAALVGGAAAAGLGARAFCVAHNGLGMETEYVSFNPPRAARSR
jgi:hypothetical protein